LIDIDIYIDIDHRRRSSATIWHMISLVNEMISLSVGWPSVMISSITNECCNYSPSANITRVFDNN